jgi:hypothetical protein
VELFQHLVNRAICLLNSNEMSQQQPSSSSQHQPSGEDDWGSRTYRKKKKKLLVPVTSGYVGKCKDIKAHVYDVTPGKSGFDAFAKTTREIGEYIAQTVKDAGEFWPAMDPENLGFTALVLPPDPDDLTNVLMMECWKMAFKHYSNTTKQHTKATSQAFAIVLGQCSPTVIDRLRASNQWAAISDASNLIKLLQLICTSMYTRATSKNLTHSLIDADQPHDQRQVSLCFQGPCRRGRTPQRRPWN